MIESYAGGATLSSGRNGQEKLGLASKAVLGNSATPISFSREPAALSLGFEMERRKWKLSKTPR
jgi:hypothetical protein